MSVPRRFMHAIGVAIVLAVSFAAHAAELPPEQRNELAEALCAFLLAASKHENDVDHARTANRRLVQLHLDDAGAAPHLIDAATALAETHPETALALVTHAMSIANAQARNGAGAAPASSAAGLLTPAIGVFSVSVT